MDYRYFNEAVSTERDYFIPKDMKGWLCSVNRKELGRKQLLCVRLGDGYNRLRITYNGGFWYWHVKP
jgi:hypothetical protein